MGIFEVTVYQSRGVTNYCDDTWGDPYRAEDRVKTYFEAPDYSNHSVSVTKSGKTITPPTENIFESFEANYPCDRTFTVEYDKLAYWWKDYVDCELTEAQDCDLLITSAGSGGLAINDHYATASRGHDLAHLPSSYDEWGTSNGHGGMQTAMHETGHAFLDKGASWEHNSGYVYERSGGNYRTPMGHGGSSGENECNDPHPDHTDGHEELEWYQHCAVDNWVHTG
jgi:hypothetical protein